MQRAALALCASAHRIAGRLGGKQRFESRKQLWILRLALGAPTTRGADTLGRTLGQTGFEFTPPAADRAAVQARDLGQQRLPATADALRLECDEPAALLLIKPADQQIDLLMQLSLGMRLMPAASGTRTKVNNRGGYWQLQSLLVQRGEL